jgi:hypothetical protein
MRIRGIEPRTVDLKGRLSLAPRREPLTTELYALNVRRDGGQVPHHPGTLLDICAGSYFIGEQGVEPWLEVSKTPVLP